VAGGAVDQGPRPGSSELRFDGWRTRRHEAMSSTIANLLEAEHLATSRPAEPALESIQTPVPNLGRRQRESKKIDLLRNLRTVF
jgi:hypothetical protein